MGELGAAEILLDRLEEARVLRELGQLALRLVVEPALPRDLLEEAGQGAVPRHRGHAEEDLARLPVLGDRLEALDVVEPVVEHVG